MTAKDMDKIKVLSVFGTRPEVIKMAPVVKELEKRRKRFVSITVNTGQHRELSQPFLELFSIVPDYDLAIMRQEQTLDGIVKSILGAFPKVLDEVGPDIILVQGDTSSAFASALTSFHHKTSIGHVEAGLRTGNKYSPFPEEKNRQLISVLSDLHFAPTTSAREKLLCEGIAADRVFVTGNTVIDALQLVVKRGATHVFRNGVLEKINFDSHKIIVVTAHRRESFGRPMLDIASALRCIVERYVDIEIVVPVHHNPNVKRVLLSELRGADRVHLIEPLEYEEFVHLLNKCYMVLTDSGGIQEEAPSLGKPVLVLRNDTERPEGIKAGTAKLVGTNPEKIVEEVMALLEDHECYRRMAEAVNPYGDGTAAARICNILETQVTAAARGQ